MQVLPSDEVTGMVASTGRNGGPTMDSPVSSRPYNRLCERSCRRSGQSAGNPYWSHHREPVISRRRAEIKRMRGRGRLTPCSLPS